MKNNHKKLLDGFLLLLARPEMFLFGSEMRNSRIRRIPCAIFKDSKRAIGI